MSDTPYDPTFYAAQADGSQRSAQRIVPVVQEWVDARSVLDVGCGVGTFLSVFAARGVTDIQGVDGDYVPRDRLRIDPARFRPQDLATPLDLGRRFDLVMSLEVAEHLPDEAADRFVESLCRHGHTVLFSAAVPRQGGTHHVNERWPSYWIPKFAARGYEVFDVIRPAVWDDDTVEYWYRQNCLLFADAEGQAASPRLAAARGEGLVPGAPDVVHPALFLSKTAQEAAVAQARSILETFRRLSREGGRYSFDANPDGSVTIRRA